MYSPAGHAAAASLVAFVTAIPVGFFYNLPDKRLSRVTYLLGVLTMLVQDVYAFTFGSSADSQRNTEMLHEQSRAG